MRPASSRGASAPAPEGRRPGLNGFSQLPRADDLSEKMAAYNTNSPRDRRWARWSRRRAGPRPPDSELQVPFVEALKREVNGYLENLGIELDESFEIAIHKPVRGRFSLFHAIRHPAERPAPDS